MLQSGAQRAGGRPCGAGRGPRRASVGEVETVAGLTATMSSSSRGWRSRRPASRGTRYHEGQPPVALERLLVEVVDRRARATGSRRRRPGRRRTGALRRRGHRRGRRWCRRTGRGRPRPRPAIQAHASGSADVRRTRRVDLARWFGHPPSGQLVIAVEERCSRPRSRAGAELTARRGWFYQPARTQGALLNTIPRGARDIMCAIVTVPLAS